MTQEPSWVQRVWRGWRREIVRGALLFGVVVACGLFVAAQVRAFDPVSLMRNAGFDFNDHNDGDREWVESARFAGAIRDGETIWVRNLNGPVSIEAAEGDSFLIVAEKSWRHSDPHTVDVQMVPAEGRAGGSVTVCALWQGRSESCGPGGEYQMRGHKGHSDVAVRFVVHVPAGVRLDATTVNGGLEAVDVASPLKLVTVNGGIDIATATGPVNATAVNGNVEAQIHSLAAGVELETVNGSIEIQVPASINAQLEASTVNGKVDTELPVQVTGKISPRHLRAMLGNGGAPLKLTTVNGSVSITELGADPAPVVAPAPPAHPCASDGGPCAAPRRTRAPRAAPIP